MKKSAVLWVLVCVMGVATAKAALGMYVMTGKNWDKETVNELTALIPKELGVKAVFFFNKPNLNKKGYFTTAISISLYDPTMHFENNRWVMLHEIGHAVQWVKERKISEAYANNYANMVVT